MSFRKEGFLRTFGKLWKSCPPPMLGARTKPPVNRGLREGEQGQFQQLSLELVDVRLSLAKHMIKTQKDLDNLYNAGKELHSALTLLDERGKK